jgi:hypothetical protein
MKITDTVIAQPNSPPPVKPKNTSLRMEAVLDPVPRPPTVSRSTVSISGESLLRQRVFFSDDPTSKLPLQVKNTTETRMQPSVNFLTVSDRQLLGQIFEYAQEQGADLHYVDSLAFELALYRQADNGRIMLPANRGKDFDLEGHSVSYSFTDKDAATAKRILGSEALKTTRLDQGFIRFTLDKDYSAISHNDFEFMEQVINKFSARGADVPPLDAKFARHEYLKDNYIKHVSKKVYRDRGGSNLGGTDPVLSKKKSIKQQPPAAPETLKDILRRIIFKAMRTSFSTRVPSLAEFLMKMRR